MQTNTQSQQNGFKYVKKLGQGQFGIVYLVQNKRNGELFALKKIPFSLLNDRPVLKKYIESEISIMKSIQNTNVVRMVDNSETENSYYLLMEYCEGGDLTKYINKLQIKGEYNEKTIVSLFLQIVEGFIALHNSNIIHRDIKPDNILMKEGVPKIADFGLSKNLESTDGIAQTYVGTRMTMAPEILEGNSSFSYSYEADVYSLGVLFFFMLQKRYPYSPKNEFQLLNLSKLGEIQFNDSPFPVSQHIKQLIRLMMTYSPQLRPTVIQVKSHLCFIPQLDNALQLPDKICSTLTKESLLQTSTKQTLYAYIPIKNYVKFLKSEVRSQSQLETSSVCLVFTSNQDVNNAKIAETLQSYASLIRHCQLTLKITNQIHFVAQQWGSLAQNFMRDKEDKVWEHWEFFIDQQIQQCIAMLGSVVDDKYLHTYDLSLFNECEKIFGRLNDYCAKKGSLKIKKTSLSTPSQDYFPIIREETDELCSFLYDRMEAQDIPEIKKQSLALQLYFINLIQVVHEERELDLMNFETFNFRIFKLTFQELSQYALIGSYK